MNPYLVLSRDLSDKGRYDYAIAVLHTPDHDPLVVRNEPYESREAYLLCDACERLGIPVRRTYQSRAFTTHIQEDQQRYIDLLINGKSYIMLGRTN